MDQTQIAWIAAFAALGGSLVGALASIVAIAVQAHGEAKRHRQELAVSLAKDDRERHLGAAKEGQNVPPLAVYVAFYVAMLREVERGSLTPEKVKELDADNRRLRASVYEIGILNEARSS